MKALTLHQPWAWLVAQGWKEVETRSWNTSYRGPLAIHAGKRRDRDGIDLWRVQHSPGGQFAYSDQSFDSLPFGSVVAICNLVACLPTGDCEKQGECVKRFAAPKLGWKVEKLFGNYESGRWAWILQDVVLIDPPIPAHGWQRIWNWKPPANAAAELGLQP